MDKTILLTKRNGKECAAVLEDGRLTEYLEAVDNDPIQPGNIFLGSVANVVKALSCAFVNIGDKRTAMLPLSEIPESMNCGKPVHAGMDIPVQITKVPGSDKGALLTANIKFPGKHCVLLPYSVHAGVSKKITDETVRNGLLGLCIRIKPDGMGMILRTSAADSNEAEIMADVQNTFAEWDSVSIRATHLKAPALLYEENDVARKVVRDLLTENTDKILVEGEELLKRAKEAADSMCPALSDKILPYSFDIEAFTLYSVPSQIERSHQRKVYLQSGGFLVFDRTEALTVIDVNSGTKTTGHSVFDTAYEINMEAAEEIVRQLRLRDIGGIIVIDFIDMDTKARKEELTHYLRACFKTDRAKVNVVGLTGLGLMELTRKKSNERQKD